MEDVLMFVPPQRITELVGEVSTSAFRLETRDVYDDPAEVDAYARFIDNGDPGDMDWFIPWTDLVATLTGRGVRVSRARVVTVPMGDYAAFCLRTCAYNCAAGEQVRYLDRRDAVRAGIPAQDFWLLDGARVAILRYDHHDRCEGAWVVDRPDRVGVYGQWENLVWHRAMPHTRFGRLVTGQPWPLRPRRR